MGILRIAVVGVLLAGSALLAGGCQSGSGETSTNTSARDGTLVLYDTSGEYGALGELYAAQAANLASRFGVWKAHPVTGYTAKEATEYQAVIYIGSSYGEPLPAAFLDDVAAMPVPVMWINENLYQLTSRNPDVSRNLGFSVDGSNRTTEAPVTEVRYRGTSLTRDQVNKDGVTRVTVTDQNSAMPVAEAVHADGTVTPWGVRSGKFTYLGELPFTYLGSGDRYLAFADLLFDLLAPDTRERHRALVRLEDVGPRSDPATLRAIGDYLSGKGVPFSVAVYSEYLDPSGTYNGGQPVRIRLSESPEVVAALRYLTTRGGTLIAHGFTHQYGQIANPYGVSGEDFEFYRARVDSNNQVVLDGPVPDDSPGWAVGRLEAARAEWAAAGLPRPEIFEFPHYAASMTDYRAVSERVTARYERAMYFPGVLTGSADPTGFSPARFASQFFPYPVRDVYGVAVIPETLGHVQTQGYNQHQATLPAQLIESARRQLVVRDGFASFFYHPMLGMEYLPGLVAGIQALGYTFVAASDGILPR
jgi:uncharacterized protein YdaL